MTERARRLHDDLRAVALALRNPRTPRAAKVLVGCVIAYAASPIDLIPDFIPLLGHLDDLVIVPLGIALAIRLIPADILAESRERIRETAGRPRSGRVVAAAAVVAVWCALLALVVLLIR